MADEQNERNEQSNDSGQTGGHQDGQRSTDEGNLHVTDHGGEGRAVVLLHGWPLTSDSWSEQIGPLKEAGYRVVTYDRRGFGQSGPGDGYDYDQLAGDLDNVLSDLDLTEVTLVGFSMGGGEVARYLASYGSDRVHSVVFAAAVTPYLMKSEDNPDGPLEEEAFQELRQGLADNRETFFPQFVESFFTAGDEVKVSDQVQQDAVSMARTSNQEAALACMDAWATTDFREDLAKVHVPTLVIHGDSDATVPFEGAGKRTGEAIGGSEVVVIKDAPHGLNTSHAEEFNRALLSFLQN